MGLGRGSLSWRLARAAREVLYRLEALEPRTLLAGEPPLIDVMDGDHVEGIFPPRAKQVTYAFDAEGGATYVFTKTGAPQAAIEIWSGDGKDWFLAGSTGSEPHVWKAPRAGRFLLELRDESRIDWRRDPVGYTLDAHPLEDDFGDDAKTASPFPDDGFLSGRIERFDDEDWFSIEARPGLVYRFIFSDWYDGHAATKLYGPEVPADDKENTSSYSALILKPTFEATYYIRAYSPEERRRTGDRYYVYLNTLVDDYGDAPARSSPWDIGSPLVGSLEYQGDRDAVRFEARAGQTFVFNSPEPLDLRVIDSDGLTDLGSVENAYTKDSGNSWLRWAAPHDGTYYLSIGPYYTWYGAYYVKGPYAVHATRVPDDDVDGRVGARPLAIGRTVTATLPVPGAADWYRVDAVAGVRYTFMAPDDQASPSLGARMLQLFRPDGAPERGDYYPVQNITREMFSTYVDESVSWVAPENGVYYLVVSAFDPSRTGSYALTTTAIVDDHRNDAMHATPLTPGTPLRGRVQYDDDADWFALDVAAGHSYVVNYTPDPALPTDESSYGYEEFSWADNSDSYPLGWHLDRESGDARRFAFTATESRRLFFDVEGYGDVPAYTVKVTEMAVPPLAEARAIGSGQEIAGTLARPGQFDLYRFDGLPGTDYHFRFPSAGPGRLSVYVMDSAMRIVTAYDRELSPGSGMFWTRDLLGAEGRGDPYYLAVAAFDPSRTGDYDIRLDAAADPPESAPSGVRLRLGEPVEGITSSEGDADVFRFGGEAGKIYRFVVHSSSYVHDASVLGPEGTPLPGTRVDDEWVSETDSHLTGIWATVPADGTYFLSLGSAGRYIVELADIAPAPPPEDPPGPSADDLLPNRVVLQIGERRLSDAGVDLYSFRAKAGRAYRLYTWQPGSLEDTILGLIDPETMSVVEFNDDSPYADHYTSEIEWTAPRSGDFYLFVTGYQGESGTYSLTVRGPNDGERDVESLTPADADSSGVSWAKFALAAVDAYFDGQNPPYTLHDDGSVTGVIPPKRQTAWPVGPEQLILQSAEHRLDDAGIDLYAVHAIANRTYVFRTELDTLEDSLLGLIDPQTFTVLDLNDDPDDRDDASSAIVWTAPNSGDFYLFVSDYDEEAGTYRLAVSARDDQGLQGESLALLDPKSETNSPFAALALAALDAYFDGQDPPYTLNPDGTVNGVVPADSADEWAYADDSSDDPALWDDEDDGLWDDASADLW